MKIKNSSWCLLSLVVLAGVAYAPASRADSAEKAVMAAEQQWLQSQRTNNADLIAPLLADDVVETNTDGKLTTGKAANLAESKAVKWSSVDYTDTKVIVHGDTAVATGVFTGKGTDKAGKALDLHERYTDTWAKMADGKWQCVASHSSAIKK